VDFLVNFTNWFRNLPASAKISLFLVIIGAVTAGILLNSQIKHSGYQYLYTNLSLTDVNSIAAKLQSMSIDAQIQGDAILVPAVKVLELRNQMAAEGLPRGGGTGFEIFDKKNFGATEFEQRINYVRALQGELARTISAIDGIQEARVHIVLPEKKLFEEDKQEPKASVALTLYKGRRLANAQVSGIVHLVVTSVEGLTEANINVIDQDGNVLFKATGDDAASLSSKHLEVRSALENSLENRITEMMEKIVGPGGVSVSVSADMDFSQVEKTVESINPDSRVATSEHTITDSSSGSSGSAGGVPGTASNTPGGTGSSSNGNSSSSKRKESNTTYAVSKTVQKILEPVGVVKKLNIAVLVDGTYKTEKAAKGAAGKKAGTQKTTYVPRTADELQKMTGLVKKAVGFSSDRGDEVKVENMQFKHIEQDNSGEQAFVSATNSSRWMMFLLDNGKVVGIVLICGIIFILLVRLINSYAPPVEMAYANLIGEKAGSVAQALPPGAQVNIVKRDDENARAKAEQVAENIPELNLKKEREIQFREVEPQALVVDAPITSEEKLRLQAAKMQTEQIVSNNTDEAVQVIRSWMAED